MSKETHTHDATGIKSYSTVDVMPNGFCSICYRDTPKVFAVESVEVSDGNHRTTSLFVCSECVAKFESIGAGQELFCGEIQARK
jgi:hypothetical protein